MLEKSIHDEKLAFITSTRLARENRRLSRKQNEAATRIQAFFISLRCRKRCLRASREKLDFLLKSYASETATFENAKFLSTFRCFLFYSNGTDLNRLIDSLRFILQSLLSASTTVNYAYLCVGMKASWLYHMKRLLLLCMKKLLFVWKSNFDSSIRTCFTVLLNTLVSFTSLKTFQFDVKEPCRFNPQSICLSFIDYLYLNDFFPIFHDLYVHTLHLHSAQQLRTLHLKAMASLCLRIHSHKQDHKQFLTHILSIPGFIYEMQNKQVLDIFLVESFIGNLINYLSSDLCQTHLLVQLKSIPTLILLANLSDLFDKYEMNEPNILAFLRVIVLLLEHVSHVRDSSTTVSRGQSVTYWTNLLGWCEHAGFEVCTELKEDDIVVIKKQLQLLWSSAFVNRLLSFVDIAIPQNAEHNMATAAGTRSLRPLTSLLDRCHIRSHRDTSSTASTQQQMSVTAPSHTRLSISASACSLMAEVCRLYKLILLTLKQHNTEITTGICFGSSMLRVLWNFLRDYTPLDLYKEINNSTLQLANNQLTDRLEILSMFCTTMSIYLSVIEDEEMHAENGTFTLCDYRNIACLINSTLYRHLVDDCCAESLVPGSLYYSMHTLLIRLYRRDCRRNFMRPGAWLIPTSKKSICQSLLVYAPHTVSLKKRFQLLRKYIQQDRNELLDTLDDMDQLHVITIRRLRLLEDGYNQLNTLTSSQLKTTIRVRFVNRLGLDEAGIDQDGVFKEFLEETVRHAFDPALNLFRLTSDNYLYPSSTSSTHSEHFKLFEFVGKLLGKAVYEGILVEVPLAAFFLSELLGHSYQDLYCSLDELSSLDPDLYRNILSVKHYSGDVSDLCLTLSYDEDIMGEIITHDLVPGGRVIPVTNCNKIAYVYMLANFRMRVQIKEQTLAFVRGFRSILKSDWLNMFSAPELQALISGGSGRGVFDLDELRKHTRYYGGFHDKHQVIVWFWQVLSTDFSHAERCMFLKFVTACSKPPLMGFSHLDPPFSIRCISDEDDATTDSFGSILRGFFSMNRRESVTRLPSSSTCFNLLKLPNYKRKSTLRDRLKYSISNNTGFELS